MFRQGAGIWQNPIPVYWFRFIEPAFGMLWSIRCVALFGWISLRSFARLAEAWTWEYLAFALYQPTTPHAAKS